MGECIKFGRGKIVTIDPVFANNDWEKIIAACQSGKVPDTWKVGDQKLMTINGKDYPIDIIGINHDDYSDGTGKAPLTFQMHDCYDTYYPMNSTNTNAGGWNASAMRTTHLPVILSKMPTEVQAGIKAVNKKAYKGQQSGTMITSSDKLFLLAEVEVRGGCTYSNPGEGSRYDYYKTSSNRKKMRNGSACRWWSRSPYNANHNYFCYTSTSGGADAGTSTDNSGTGCAFAFCF